MSRSRTVAVLALVLLAALLAGLHSIRQPLGRDFSGYQSAFFALSASQYEQHGLLRLRGYPALTEGLPCIGGMDDLVRAEDSAGPALVYKNHPPTAFWLGWLGVRLLGSDFDSPQRHQAAAVPFLLAHLLTLLLIWWWLAAEWGSARALAGLLAAASTPIAWHHGALPNLENPALPGVLLALGAFARWQTTRQTRLLLAAAAGLLLAASVTFAPLFFALALGVASRQWRAGLLLIGAALLPLLLHAWNASALGSLHARPLQLIEPLLDGSVPPWEWLLIQGRHAVAAVGLPWLIVALAGACFAPRRLLLPALAGVSLYWLAFYRHTAEEQWQFQLWILPLIGLGVSALLARLPERTAWVCALVLAGLGGFGAWRFEQRLQQHPLPSPEASAARLRELVPAGSVALLPEAAGKDLGYAYQSGRDLRPESHEMQGQRRASLRLSWDRAAGWQLGP